MSEYDFLIKLILWAVCILGCVAACLYIRNVKDKIYYDNLMKQIEGKENDTENIGSDKRRSVAGGRAAGKSTIYASDGNKRVVEI